MRLVLILIITLFITVRTQRLGSKSLKLGNEWKNDNSVK